MSDHDLSIRYQEVRDLGLGLEIVAGELEASEDIAEDYAEQVSHDDLADALEEFASNWSDKRTELVESIRAVAWMAELAGDTFQGLDRDLADAVQE
ncbi:hypothetical protein [Streptomyces sp. YIM 98790]|uniref:hypothetical protein n=1 Tax=Streptomyces sp. YIM 98790 TaxID=2689077 RepID=UPI00140BE87C|nr:hypothetical protein [Streptomyces sp. YIM 98790]